MFNVNDRVKIVRVGGDLLEGQLGTIIGNSSGWHTITFPIVLLDIPDPRTGYLAITMISSCLELLTNGGPNE